MNVRAFLFGSPLRTTAIEQERLSKVTALPVFASDALSSVAYATEEILIVLVVAGSTLLHLSLPVALVICGLLAVVTLSYRQTIHAYPQGGGSYRVAHENLGEWPGLVAAAALLIDYILTVSVSIAAGVRAITSAAPALIPYNVPLCLGIVLFITWLNLRGTRESAAILAPPTYSFIAAMLLMVAAGLWQLGFGGVAPAIHPAAAGPIPAPLPAAIAPIALIHLLLRAFSSGCTALTGIEAVSNGVPAFRKPEAKNASFTLVVLAILLATLFLGITAIAVWLGIAPREDESLVSQIARIVFHGGPLYYVVQIATTLILVLAANTSFAGFPRLASILARDGYLPRQLGNLGDRLAFSNGIIALAVAASLLLVLFAGNTHQLIPLYALGVFLCFTLSQTGMVWWWFRHRGPRWPLKAAVNGLGAGATLIAVLVVIEGRFLDGAWILLLVIPAMLLLFHRVKKHYREVSQQLGPRMGGLGEWLPWVHRFHPKVVVPISKMHPGTLAAMQLARALSDDVTAVIVDLDPGGTAGVRLAWRALRFNEPLVVLDSPFRSVIEPLMAYLEEVDRREPERGRAVVVLPEFVPARWWQNLLHNQTALLLKAELLYRKSPAGDSRIVIDVPYRLRPARGR
jgi:amino acid transporter